MVALTNHQPQFAVRNLGKIFVTRGSSVSVLDGLNIDVFPGEFFVIVGPSGCGKTTFLRLIQGLDADYSGSIEMEGGAERLRRAFVFQSDTLYPWRTVLANVQLGLEIAGVTKAMSLDRAHAMIGLVGLQGFEQHYPNELSGGMRQRVNLARALAVDPDALLMDEPFAALDAITREAMQQELLQIVEETGKTVLFITHQIDEAVLLGDRVAVMSSRPGRITRTLNIDLPRPRTLQLKRTVRFHEYVDEIRGLIVDDQATNEKQGDM